MFYRTEAHRRGTRLATLIVIAITAQTTMTPSAVAHDWESRYNYTASQDGRWYHSGARMPNIGVRVTMASPPWSSRTSDAAKRWDMLGQTLDFVWRGQQTDWPTTCTTRKDYNENVIYRGTWDGRWSSGDNENDLAVTTVCRDTTTKEAITFHMIVDSAERWFTGEEGSTPVGNGIADEFDLFSVLTHEFGHAGGWTYPSSTGGHFREDDTSTCLVADIVAEKQTMCGRIDLESTYGRTLGEHDQHVFVGAYDN